MDKFTKFFIGFLIVVVFIGFLVADSHNAVEPIKWLFPAAGLVCIVMIVYYNNE